MKKALVFAALLMAAVQSYAQTSKLPKFTIIKNNPATPVKNQYRSGTCWCFSSTALVESELLYKNRPETDLSEAFTVYSLYMDKAEKYVRRRGNTRFTEGGIQQDMLYCADNYGAMPQSIYPGVGKDTILNHDDEMEKSLKAYLDDLLKANPDTIPSNWKVGFKQILNKYIGTPPESFTYDGKDYTPKTFAAENVPVKLSDFLGLTSFTHHPYYTTFAMEVPDNYNSNMFYNLPLNDFISTVKDAINNGFTVAWDADVTNKGFRQKTGLAKWVYDSKGAGDFLGFTEQKPNAQIRQKLFDDQVTQDDHLMQITGLAKDDAGNEYFIVKNSWGKIGPFDGYIYVSMPYFTINTISVLIDKNALPKDLVTKAANNL